MQDLILGHLRVGPFCWLFRCVESIIVALRFIYQGFRYNLNQKRFLLRRGCILLYCFHLKSLIVSRQTDKGFSELRWDLHACMLGLIAWHHLKGLLRVHYNIVVTKIHVSFLQLRNNRANMRKLCQRSNRFVVSKLPCFKIFIIIYIYAVSTILGYIQLFQLRLFPEQSGKVE